MTLICLVLMLSSVREIQPLKLSDTQAMYTGLVRKVGDSSTDISHILSFGPDNDQIEFLLCMSQGFSGQV